MSQMPTPGLVDVHHHLLPGVDDGPRSWDESLAMASAAAAAGIRIVVATPHVQPGRGTSPGWNTIVELVDELRTRLASAGIALEVVPGAEVYPVPDLSAWLERQERQPFLGYAARVRYMLLDMPLDHLPPRFGQLVFDVALSGLVPIVAHPERNRDLAAHPEKVASLVDRGAVVQVTAGSLLGQFGPAAEESAWWLVRHDVARVVATDAHDVTRRSPATMRDAFRLLSRTVGDARAGALCSTVPEAIARGDIVPWSIPPMPAEPTRPLGARLAADGRAHSRRPVHGLVAWLASRLTPGN